jgi:hypothetical protein
MAGPNACGSETSLFNGIARRLRALKAAPFERAT